MLSCGENDFFLTLEPDLRLTKGTGRIFMKTMDLFITIYEFTLVASTHAHNHMTIGGGIQND